MITVTLHAAISLCGRILKNKKHSHTEGLFWYRYPGAVGEEEMRCGMESPLEGQEASHLIGQVTRPDSQMIM